MAASKPTSWLSERPDFLSATRLLAASPQVPSTFRRFLPDRFMTYGVAIGGLVDIWCFEHFILLPASFSLLPEAH